MSLLEYGSLLREGQGQGIVVELTPDDTANTLVCSDPNAFLFAVLFDQGIRAERAWAAPYWLRERLGHLNVFEIASMDVGDLRDAISKPPALHRYVDKMSKWVKSAAARVVERYGGDASRLWDDNPIVEDVINRLIAFDGVGQKKASMAANLLRRELRVPMRGSQTSQVSFDVHINRVFRRCGLVAEDTESAVQATARRLSPSDPGELDLPAWWIGRNWCHPAVPDCNNCPVGIVCPKELRR